MKTFIITLSKVFPKGHRKEGKLTFFKEKFMFGQQWQFCSPKDRDANYPKCDECLKYCEPLKIHTIRSNYTFWAKRFKEIERGKACISVRQWTDKPYHSKQVEIARLTKEHGIGIQKLTFKGALNCLQIDGEYSIADLSTLAENDGLSFEDWESWFTGYNLAQPMAIIHFTKFRY